MADLSREILPIARRLKTSSLLEPCQLVASDNPPWDEAKGRYLIVRLSPLRDMVSSTGHLFLHGLLREALGSGPYIDFAFFPSRPDRKELSGRGLPYLYGTFGLRGAEDYSAVLVSCSYALELVNLPCLLLNSGIPLRSSERRAPRSDGRPWPLIILGGSNALASQSLIFPDGDSFVDGIFFGEGESGGSALVRAMAESEGLTPAERALRIAGATESFWPSGALYRDTRVRVATFRGGPGRSTPVDRYPLFNTEQASTTRIQLSFGCPSTCSFCFEGWEHKPYREIPKAAILENARSLARNTGANTLELYSFNFNAHTDAAELILELNRIFERVNMMSQRADLLVTTPGLLELELAAEKNSFTLGVEGVSGGMRAYYSKGLTDKLLNRLLERLLGFRIRELKLFYILAGVETEADILEFESFCAFLAGLRSAQDSGLRVLFSFGYLVRMPFTPLRGTRLCLDRPRLESLAGRIKGIVEKSGFEFRLASDWDEYVVDQMLVLGPYETAYALERAAREGSLYDLSTEGTVRLELEKVIRGTGGLEKGGLTGPFLEEKRADYPYALGFLDTAVGPEYLEKRRDLALRRIDGGSCMAGFDPGETEGLCQGCGACSAEAERDALVRHRILPMGYRRIEELGELVKAKRRMRPRYIRARLPQALSGATREFLDAWLLRSAFSRRAELVGKLFRVEEAVWASPPWRDRMGSGVTGECVLALYGLERRGESWEPRLEDDAFRKAADALSEALGCEARSFDLAEEPSVSDVAVSITLNRAEGSEELRERARSYLASLKLNAIEKKTEGGRLFEIASKDRKKRVLSGLRLQEGAGTAPRLLLEGGSKLDISPLFPRPEDRALARIQVDRLTLG